MNPPFYLTPAALVPLGFRHVSSRAADWLVAAMAGRVATAEVEQGNRLRLYAADDAVLFDGPVQDEAHLRRVLLAAAQP